jgi:hypothetical protein
MRRLRQERSRGCFSPSRHPRRPLLRSQMRRPSAPKLRVIPFGLPPLSSGTEVAALTPESGVGSLGHETPVSAAEVAYGASSDVKAEGEAVQPASPSSGVQIATPAPDENCKRDGDRLAQLRSSPTSDVARASKPTSGTHRTASLLKGRPKGHASACASRAACLWRGRERLFAVNRGRKLFTLFPLKVFSGAKIASR